MAKSNKRRIKFRLFHYYEERTTLGQPTLVEKQAFFGQVVEIPREEDIARGEELGAFYTNKEEKQIQDGTYRGPDWETLAAGPMVPAFTPEEEAARAGTSMEVPSPEIEEIAGNGEFDAANASSEEIAEHIKSEGLTVPQTVDLAGGNADLAEKIIEAENMASENDPRAGVIGAMEKLSAGNGGGE